MKRCLTICFAAFAFCILLPACQSVAKIASAGAQAAAASGIIDQDTADTISASAQAISKAAEEITPEQEYYIGRAVAANILNTYQLWDGNPELTAYLNRICNAITVNSPRPDVYNGYHLAILDSNEINAFATSGGHIYVTRGLIAVAKSEDALAGVIAHEIAHIQLQHSIKAIRTSRITQAILVTGANAASAAGMELEELTDVFNESVEQIVTTLVNNGYSQVQEFDADSTALGLLASAGYNPSGLTDMLKELQKIQGGSSGGFNRTHPTPDSRLSSAEKAIIKYRVTDTSSSREARFNAVR